MKIPIRLISREMNLMCAEKEPLDCHRTLLVGQALRERGVDVAHIHADGGLEPHASAMDRLLAGVGLDPGEDLFRRHQSRDALIAEAIARTTVRSRRSDRRPATIAKQATAARED